MFFFSSRRRHTRYIGDWSSDVCSSDLLEKRREADRGSSMPGATATPDVEVIVEDARGGGGGGGRPPDGGDGGDDGDYGKEIGRASCRERGENLGEAGSVKEEGEDGE